ncbi:hypothetical protein CMUS01_09375 [Colletotrichum musicola]|uniref:Uncharacterized protein n=1 Tax=Colletotrichum musicola TaxID=2175873 RepID=A0A8H6K8C0_9PEZI|nr:hypothetical protein CMUS01_09375 [Colletotrichum musicola]
MPTSGQGLRTDQASLLVQEGATSISTRHPQSTMCSVSVGLSCLVKERPGSGPTRAGQGDGWGREIGASGAFWDFVRRAEESQCGLWTVDFPFINDTAAGREGRPRKLEQE